MKRRLLVTGHRGLLGSACVRRLSTEYEVITYPGDLFDAVKFRRWMGALGSQRPDYVIHAAAKVGGVKSNRDYPVEFLNQNIRIQDTVINAAADYGVKKLVFIGTSCLYPRDAPVPVIEGSLLTGPFEPAVEAYAIAKLAGYSLCKSYFNQHGKHFLTANPCNLYGLNDNYSLSAHVIPALIRKIVDARRGSGILEVWGDGSQVREFLYADDCADALGIILKDVNSGLINIGTGIGTSIKELVELLVELYGDEVDIVWNHAEPGGIPIKTFDMAYMNVLGWKPKVSLREGLALTYRDFISTQKPRGL